MSIKLKQTFDVLRKIKKNNSKIIFFFNLNFSTISLIFYLLSVSSAQKNLLKNLVSNFTLQFYIYKFLVKKKNYLKSFVISSNNMYKFLHFFTFFFTSEVFLAGDFHMHFIKVFYKFNLLSFNFFWNNFFLLDKKNFIESLNFDYFYVLYFFLYKFFLLFFFNFFAFTSYFKFITCLPFVKLV